MNSGRTPSHYVHSPRCSVAAASRVIRGGAVCASPGSIQQRRRVRQAPTICRGARAAATAAPDRSVRSQRRWVREKERRRHGGRGRERDRSDGESRRKGKGTGRGSACTCVRVRVRVRACWWREGSAGLDRRRVPGALSLRAPARACTPGRGLRGTRPIKRTCAARVAAAGSRSSRAHLPCLVLRRVPQELAKWPPPLARSGVSERGTTAFRSGPSVHTAAAGAPLAGAWPSRPRGAPPPHAAQSRVSRSQGRALPRRAVQYAHVPSHLRTCCQALGTSVASPARPASKRQRPLNEQPNVLPAEGVRTHARAKPRAGHACNKSHMQNLVWHVSKLQRGKEASAVRGDIASFKKQICAQKNSRLLPQNVGVKA